MREIGNGQMQSTCDDEECELLCTISKAAWAGSESLNLVAALAHQECLLPVWRLNLPVCSQVVALYVCLG
jgi:hypothetical protein